MKFLQVLIFCFVSVSALLSGTNIREIEDLAATGETSAIAALRDSADNGSTRAMNFLGYLYWQGLGTRQLRDSALYFLCRAEAAGDLKAAANLGHLMLVGDSCLPADTLKALSLLQKAAEHGLPSALRELDDYFSTNSGDSASAGSIKIVADAYSHGRVLPYNYHRSIELYNRAALLGDTTAQRIISELLEIFPDILEDVPKMN